MRGGSSCKRGLSLCFSRAVSRDFWFSRQRSFELTNVSIRIPEIHIQVATSVHEFERFLIHVIDSFNRFSRSLIKSIIESGGARPFNAVHTKRPAHFPADSRPRFAPVRGSAV